MTHRDQKGATNLRFIIFCNKNTSRKKPFIRKDPEKNVKLLNKTPVTLIKGVF